MLSGGGAVLVVVVCSTAVADGAKCPCSDATLCERVQVPPRKEVFAFMVDNSFANWRGYDWDLVTTVALFTDSVNPEFLCHAHAKKVRVVWGAAFPVSNLTNAEQRKQWVKAQAARVRDTFTDGINVDIEDALKADQPQERKLLTVLMHELKGELDRQVPHHQLTFDVAWSPQCVDERCYDYKGLADFTDFLFVMAYDMQSQIPASKCIAGANSGYPRAEEGLRQYLKLGIKPEQLVLGLPWYGRDYPCINPANLTVCPIQPVPFRGAPCSDAVAPELDYHVVERLLSSSQAITKRQWDAAAKSPWFDYRTSQGHIHQLWYDDVESLTLKCELAKSLHIRGVGVWEADALDYTNHSQAQQMWGTFRSFLH